MNTSALNGLAGVICRAQEQDRTPMGIAFAIDSAQMFMTPETAAELERLRARVAELEQRDAEAPIAAALTEQARYVAASSPSAEESADKLTRILAPTQTLPLEDPHDSPLHHEYLVPRDLPAPLDALDSALKSAWDQGEEEPRP